MNKAVIAIVAVVVIAGGGWLIYDKNHKSTSSTATSYTTPSKSSASSNTSQSSANASDVITTKTDSKVGQYLADTNGRALYTYDSDTDGVSNCSGSCLYSWPIYQVSGSTSTLPANITVIKRNDGVNQYAYKGKALYYFSSDTQAGQVTGDGVGGFHIAKP